MLAVASLMSSDCIYLLKFNYSSLPMNPNDYTKLVNLDVHFWSLSTPKWELATKAKNNARM